MGLKIACAVESGQKKRGLFALKHARLISQNHHNIFHAAHFFLLDLNLALNMDQLGSPHPSLQEQSIGREREPISELPVWGWVVVRERTGGAAEE